MENLELLWQEVIEKKFPGVVVRKDPDIAADDGKPFYNVFMLADGNYAAFTKYFVNELWKIAEERGVEIPHLTDISVSDTKEFYPEVYEEFQKKNRSNRTGRAQRTSKSRPSRTPAAHQKAVVARKN